jgi:hypothetical protein
MVADVGAPRYSEEELEQFYLVADFTQAIKVSVTTLGGADKVGAVSAPAPAPAATLPPTVPGPPNPMQDPELEWVRAELRQAGLDDDARDKALGAFGNMLRALGPRRRCGPFGGGGGGFGGGFRPPFGRWGPPGPGFGFGGPFPHGPPGMPPGMPPYGYGMGPGYGEYAQPAPPAAAAAAPAVHALAPSPQPAPMAVDTTAPPAEQAGPSHRQTGSNSSSPDTSASEHDAARGPRYSGPPSFPGASDAESDRGEGERAHRHRRHARRRSPSSGREHDDDGPREHTHGHRHGRGHRGGRHGHHHDGPHHGPPGPAGSPPPPPPYPHGPMHHRGYGPPPSGPSPAHGPPPPHFPGQGYWY